MKKEGCSLCFPSLAFLAWPFFLSIPSISISMLTQHEAAIKRDQAESFEVNKHHDGGGRCLAAPAVGCRDQNYTRACQHSTKYYPQQQCVSGENEQKALLQHIRSLFWW